MTAVPAVEGWFTTGAEPVLLGSRCVACGHVSFPAESVFCKNPACEGTVFERVELSRRGRVWSYTDAQYQPPAPYVPAHEPYRPFGIAAVELPEGLVVLGQLAEGFGVADVRVGSEVELVVERAWTDPDGTERLMWKWRPTERATESSEARASDRARSSTQSSEARASDRGRDRGQRPTVTEVSS